MTADHVLVAELRAAEVALLRAMREAAAMAVLIAHFGDSAAETEALLQLLAELGRADARLGDAIGTAGGTTVLPLTATAAVGADAGASSALSRIDPGVLARNDPPSRRLMMPA